MVTRAVARRTAIDRDVAPSEPPPDRSCLSIDQRRPSYSCGARLETAASLVPMNPGEATPWPRSSIQRGAYFSRTALQYQPFLRGIIFTGSRAAFWRMASVRDSLF
jgi:hypothetical protein